MDVLTLTIRVIVTVLVYGGTPRSEPGNFPLDGCSTDEMDFLFLYFGDNNSRDLMYQKDMTTTLAKNLIDSNKTAREIRFAVVRDTFSANNPTIKVSSWHFSDLATFLNQSQNEVDEQRDKTKFNNLNQTIEQKINFVRYLFSEMGGVRKNTTHVAVVFLFGGHLSIEETRIIPDIVQQHEVTDIKILVAIFGVYKIGNTAAIRDTLLLSYSSLLIGKHFLLMAVCNQCLNGWLPFKQNNHMEPLSCYFVINSEIKLHWQDASETCYKYGSVLATIETKEEMDFLKTKIFAYLDGQHRLRFVSNKTSQLSGQLYVGLRRDERHFAKRFLWSPHWIYQARPLVLNNWLYGKPSGGFNNGCAVWSFGWNDTWSDVSTINTSDSRFVDGWTDVRCEERLSSFSLCEVIHLRRVDIKKMLKVKPAMNESFTRALTKGEFIVYNDNIVSVSANIGSNDFLKIYKQLGNELFPLFDCGLDAPDPRYISYVYVCDSFSHCSNRRDELFCVEGSNVAKKDQEEFGKKCIGVLCCDGSCLPLQWVHDGEVDCNVCGYSGGSEVNDESEVLNKYLKRNETCAFICNAHQCVDFSQLNDGHPDCTGAEGPIDETIGKLEQAGTCYNILGHIIWAPRCVYVKDRYGAVLGCRDMSHLDNCTDFECPEGYFKCPDTYCIPQHYVLDNEVDCPLGDDEFVHNILPCTGNFACWHSKMFLHPDLVCDGHPDCPHDDDEVDCHVTCVDGVRCMSGTITIPALNTSTNLQSFKNVDTRHRYLDLSRVNLSNMYMSFLYYFENLIIVNIHHCNIKNDDFDMRYFSLGLQELDLSYNLLQNLDARENYGSSRDYLRFWNLSYNRELTEVSFFNLKSLEILDLAHTSLLNVDRSFPVWFPSLKHLNLSFTKINQIHSSTFPSKLRLQTLDFRGLFITDFYKDFFNGLTISQDLYTDSFELCCPPVRGPNIPENTCHAPEIVISSCSDLIGVKVQRVLLWVFALLAVLGNMAVIGYRVTWDRSVLNAGYGLFVTNLGISDFIMGVYLFIIAGADYYYRDVYVLYDKRWRESVVCKLAGFLATLSCETSTFFVFLITLDRYLVMKFPFGQVKFSKISKIIVLSLSWIIGFLLALTSIVFRFEIYYSNAMCLGLPLTIQRLNGWEFSFAVFIVLNFFLVSLIAYGQRTIFRAMSKNRISQVSSRRAEDITVAKQLFLVALSNFLCWFPVGLMGLLSLCGHVISNDVYAWTVVIVLPINSAVNPLLYTIRTLLAKCEHLYSVKKINMRIFS